MNYVSRYACTHPVLSHIKTECVCVEGACVRAQAYKTKR